jgi:hypothetical protein
MCTILKNGKLALIAYTGDKNQQPRVSTNFLVARQLSRQGDVRPTSSMVGSVARDKRRHKR